MAFPLWESELLQMVEVSDDIFGVGLALSHGLRAVSDGSVWEEVNGAFDWALRAHLIMGSLNESRIEKNLKGKSYQF